MVTIPTENYRLLLNLLERFDKERKVDRHSITQFDDGYACASHYAYEGLAEALKSLPKLNKVCALCKGDTNG